MPLLKVDNLAVSIRTPQGALKIIDGIDFSMERGDKIGIVGESGCGKSITALSIMSLLPHGSAISGKIELDGENLTQLTARQYDHIRGNRIGMIFQEPMTALNPVMTIGDQIAESLILHQNLKKKDASHKVKAILDDVGMPIERFPLSLYPYQLSGGQRQRVMIAAAIACKPDILIADEPTTALDVTVQEQILNLIVNLADKSGMGLIIITHDLGVVAQTTDKTLVMYTGRLVETGTTLSVFEKMSHPYTHGLFSAIPKIGRRIHEKRHRLDSIPGQVPEINQLRVGCDFAERCGRSIERCFRDKPPISLIDSGHTIRCYNPREQGQPT